MQDLILFVGIGCLSLLFFGGHQLIWGNDANFPLNLIVVENRNFHIWSSASGYADVLKLPAIFPLYGSLMLYDLTELPFSLAFFERILLIMLISGSAFSMSQLLRAVGIKNRMAIMLGSIFYAFNFFSMLIIWFPLANIMFEYAFFPLILARFIIGLNENKQWLYALATALLWTFTITPGYGTITLLLTNFVILFSYLLFYLFANRLRGIKHAIKFYSLAMGCWLAFNIFWLVPVFTNFTATTNYASVSNNLGIFMSSGVKLFDAIRLSGYWGLTSGYRGVQYYPWYATYETLPLLLLGYVPFLFALLGYYLNRKTNNAKFFAILTLVCLVFVNGGNEPFGRLNIWLFSNPLILSAFRSVYQRFTEYLALGFSVLIALFWVRGHQFLLERKVRFNFRGKINLHHLLTIVFIVLLSGVYLFPLWTGQLQQQNSFFASKRTTVPSTYFEAAEWFNEQEGNFGILPIPYPSLTSSIHLCWNNFSDGYSGVYPFLLLSNKKFVVQSEIGTLISSGMLNGNITDSAVLSLFNIKYVIVHRDANVQFIQDHPNWVFASLDSINNSLSQISGLILKKSFGYLDVYENSKYEPNELFVSYNLPYNNASLPFLLNTIGAGCSKRITLLFNQQVSSPLIRMRIEHYPDMKTDFSDLKFINVDKEASTETVLPHWIEQIEPDQYAIVWIKLNSNETLHQIDMYYGGSSQSNSANGQKVFNFFDDFVNGFGQWSEIGSNWKINDYGGIYSNQLAIASGSSSTLIVDKALINGFMSGWFKFGETNENHFPFLSNDENGKWNYWVVAKSDGEFGWFNGSAYVSYPVKMDYYPDNWYLINVNFDFSQSMFWVVVNETLLTPDGLPTINAVGTLSEKLVNWRITNAASGRNATLWVGGAWIGNPVSEPEFCPSEPFDFANDSVETLPSENEANYDNFRLRINTSAGFYVILNERYDPNWKLATNNSRIELIEQQSLFGQLNAWFVPANDSLEIILTYQPQNQLNILYGISFGSVAIVVAIICLIKIKRVKLLIISFFHKILGKKLEDF